MSAPIKSEQFFSPDSMIWKVDRELVLLLAGGRALLMQLAHPKVAAGVVEHSHFKDDPLGRLHRTMSTMWSIVFDEPAKAQAALEQVKNIHRKVQGVIRPAEPLPAGTAYNALDPELLLWVHATLIDSAIMAYEIFVKPMTSKEKSRYYDDTTKLAKLFDIPEAIVPTSLTNFYDYMERVLNGNTIIVGPIARSLAREILCPRTLILKMAAPLFVLLTAGLLPEGLRKAYGLAWNSRKAKTFQLIIKAIQRSLLFVPPPLRIVPNARQAEKRLFASA
jgi:uncharacterized protein (DUF2236 family)